MITILLLPRAELVLHTVPPSLEVDPIVVVIPLVRTIEDDPEVVAEVEFEILQELPRALLLRLLESISIRSERRKRRWIGRGNADVRTPSTQDLVLALHHPSEAG